MQVESTNYETRNKVKVIDLSFAYETDKGSYEVLRKINLDIAENEFFCIVGPSGCGKTTLLNIIACFERPDSGQVFVDGREVASVSSDRAFVFQQDAVFPWLSVSGNIEYGLRVRKIPKEARKKRVEQLIQRVGLQGFEEAYPRELSGGMRRE